MQRKTRPAGRVFRLHFVPIRKFPTFSTERRVALTLNQMRSGVERNRFRSVHRPMSCSSGSTPPSKRHELYSFPLPKTTPKYHLPAFLFSASSARFLRSARRRSTSSLNMMSSSVNGRPIIFSISFKHHALNSSEYSSRSAS